MADLPAPTTPYLEGPARELAEATDPHPRIYELPPEQGRKILLDLQSDPAVARPDVDEEWVDVDAGQWGILRTRIIKPAGSTGPLPVVFYIHGAGWVFGDDKTHDRLFRELTVGAGRPVCSRSTTGLPNTAIRRRWSRTTPSGSGSLSMALSTAWTLRASRWPGNPSVAACRRCSAS